MPNPYLWNQINLDLVYGRGSLINEMLTALPSANGNSFGITAARRMGKTTVLRSVERDLLSGIQIYSDSGTMIVPIYIDGLTLPRPLSAQFIWGRIYHELNTRLAQILEETEAPLEFSDFVRKCSELFEMSEKVPRAIVLFDEIEHIIAHQEWAGSFFANWRALLSNFPYVSGHICAVFSGAREMANLQHDIGSPLMDVLEWRSLRNLDLMDSRRLMIEASGLVIPDDQVNLAFDETGGHPMILQYVMQKYYNNSTNGVESRIKDCIHEFEVKREWQFSEWWNKYCDATSQLVYTSLPADHSYKNVASIAAELGGYEASKALEILQHVGIAELNGDHSKAKRRCRMFTRWALKYALNVSSIAFDAHLAALLEEMNPFLREKYVSSWAIYNQLMPNYSGAVSEMRDLVTQVLHLVAPNELVESQPNFKFENDLTNPTRRQRVMYLFGVSSKEQGKALASEDELLELNATQLAALLSKSYANASALTHTTASRPLAYTAMKQAESIVAQLVSRFNEQLA
jgi:hypothetical protein